MLVLHVSACGASTLSPVGDPPNVVFTNRTLYTSITFHISGLIPAQALSSADTTLLESTVSFYISFVRSFVSRLMF